MNPGGKRDQQRSWWAASETKTSWLGSVRRKLVRRTAEESSSEGNFGVLRPRKKRA